MKKITLFIFLLALTVTQAQVTVNYDASAPLSFVEAFNISDGSSAAAFGYNPAFTQTVDGTNNTIIPNTEIWTTNNGSSPSFNTFWFSAQDVPSKTLDVLTFNEVQWDGTGTAPDVLNQELTFSVDLTAYDLDPAYTLSITITVFEAGFANFRRESFIIPNTTGATYSVTMPAAMVSANDRIWQWGFSLSGPMANPTDTTLGSATFAQTVLSSNSFDSNNFTVSPNPTKNIWNIEANVAVESVEIFDLLGKNVLSLTPNSQNVSVDASNLKNGVYLARVTSNGSTKSLKLVKN